MKYASRAVRKEQVKKIIMASKRPLTAGELARDLGLKPSTKFRNLVKELYQEDGDIYAVYYKQYSTYGAFFFWHSPMNEQQSLGLEVA